MDISMMDGYVVPVIVAGALAVGTVMKYWMPTDNKWIPTVLLVLGGLSGALLYGVDYEGIVCGMVSGLAAVGLNQVFKQHMKLPMDKDEIDTMGEGGDEDE
jgi:L-asparagine transporter-like permease